MNRILRRVAIGGIFTFGLAGSMATSTPTADVSGVSNDVRVILDADEPFREITAVATIDVDAAVSAGTGQIGLSVVVDGDAEGALAFTLTSDTTGESQSGDIVDTQAQGTARIGIDAFDGCGPGPCDEELTLVFERTDDSLVGTLGLSFSLDGLASTDTEPTAPGSITFSIDQ